MFLIVSPKDDFVQCQLLTPYVVLIVNFENNLEIWEPIGKLKELDENTIGNF
jgi:hypothetical protein